MVETFTPAVCGSRRRQRLALTGFAVGAVAASALVGAALGAVGALLGTQLAFLVAALALLAAAREAGIVRLPLPQLRRQVPERWRSELPLPVWSVGYGIGLGLGFLTFQPVATFWVACAAAVALGKPLAAGLCFAAYGAGRALMAAWRRRACRWSCGSDPRCRSRSSRRGDRARAGTYGLGQLERPPRAARRNTDRSFRRRRSCGGRRLARVRRRAGSEGDRLAHPSCRRPCRRTGGEARSRLALARVRAHGLDLQAARGRRLHGSRVPGRARDYSDLRSERPRTPLARWRPHRVAQGDGDLVEDLRASARDRPALGDRAELCLRARQPLHYFEADRLGQAKLAFLRSAHAAVGQPGGEKDLPHHW